MSRYKNTEASTGALHAIESFYDDMEGLKEEIDEVICNAPNDQIPRIVTLQETSDAIDFEQPELPKAFLDAIDNITVTCTIQTRPPGKALSRAVRCANAASVGTAGVEAIIAWSEQVRAENPDEEEDSELAQNLEALDEALGIIQDHIGEAETAEFPGMMG